MIREWARIAEEQTRQETMARRPLDTENQRGTKTQRQVRPENAPAALHRDRQQELDPRERAAKRRELLDDLPKCFKKPKDALKVDLYLDNYFRAHGDELFATTRLREALLTGNATAKELKYDNLSAKEKQSMDLAMKTEWSKWTEFGAYKKLPPKELKELLRRNPGIRPVGTRWVLTRRARTS